jgi:hypothetical protein
MLVWFCGSHDGEAGATAQREATAEPAPIAGLRQAFKSEQSETPCNTRDSKTHLFREYPARGPPRFVLGLDRNDVPQRHLQRGETKTNSWKSTRGKTRNFTTDVNWTEIFVGRVTSRDENLPPTATPADGQRGCYEMKRG